jgi:flagellar biosynthesis protein FlhA
VRDNIRLPQDVYSIRLRGVEVARGQIDVGRLLAMSPGPGAIPVEGREAVEPVFGLKALWIRSEKRGEAEIAGYTVVEPAAVVATHLAESIRTHAGEILGRQEVRALLDQVKQSAPVVVEELVPNQLTVGGVQKVLQRLLDERVSIRDGVSICEALADHAPVTKDVEILVERVREALGRSITQQYRDEKGQLGVVVLDPHLEQELVQRMQDSEGPVRLTLPPAETRAVLDATSQAVQRALRQTAHPVVLCSPSLRPALRRFLLRALPHVPVLSFAEAAHAGTVHTLATVKVEHAHQAV